MVGRAHAQRHTVNTQRRDKSTKSMPCQFSIVVHALILRHMKQREVCVSIFVQHVSQSREKKYFLTLSWSAQTKQKTCRWGHGPQNGSLCL